MMLSLGAGPWLAALGLLLLAEPGLGLQGDRVVGGLQEVPFSDPGVQAAVRFAVEGYNRASNNLRYCRVEKMLRARSQVVAGIKYYLTVQLATTQCRKNGAGFGNVDINTCPFLPASKQEKVLCEFQVWSRPWLKDTQLLSQKCSASRS
uniref:Egg-white cystatin n=1 Tax=Pelusios castaneus TaxID=367368 RepID=A0A8C8R9Z3_9SAUR